MSKVLQVMLRVLDLIIAPFIIPSALLFKNVRRVGLKRLPLCKRILFAVGVFPVRDHYYEPQFKIDESRRLFSSERNLAGIDWNIAGQISLLEEFRFAEELKDVPETKNADLEFYLHNTSFEAGDAEFWYQIIRAKKPSKIYEIGSGNSTLMAIKAIEKNMRENSDYRCKHVCIEPYEMPWLEKTPVTVLRKKVEDVSVDFFSDLGENDILFIDSSHVIRPEGDVLFEFLEILPSLNKGVIVHVHDIFSPRNYPRSWLVDEVRLWNEQYLLEAFLSNNCAWEVIGAVNYLKHNSYDRLKSVAIFLEPEREPGSFYIRKIA